MLPATANYIAHRRGDTINTRTITMQQDGSPVDLTNIDIQVDFAYKDRRVERRVGSGVTKSDPVNGEFEIDALQLDYAGVWSYDVQLVYSDGTVKTIIAGTIEIVEDVTK